MMKRIFALLLCVTLLAGALVGCSGRDYGEAGQSITVYLTDNIYDLDPAYAYKNDALASVVGLMFDTLYDLDEKGKVVPSLAKEHWTTENAITGEHTMFIRLNETAWSDGQSVSADDVLFAWQRLLEPDADFEAACLLYDIKNARAVKKGCLEDGTTITIDDVGISAPETTLLEISFEHEMTDADYDRFLLNLTCVALAPLRDDVVDKKVNEVTGRNEDWAKKGATMVCSGPFKLTSTKWIEAPVSEDDCVVGGATAQIISDFTLERNQYYYRDATEDSLFKSVAPQRICVDCTMTPDQLVEAYEAGMLMYVGNIPMSLRDKSNALTDAARVSEKSLATMSVYLNQEIEPFNNKEVRQALSMAIDREALAQAVVYAKAATGLIPTGVFETTNAKSTFRDKCTEVYSTLKVDTSAAAALLDDAGIDAEDYSFTLSCAAYDDVQCFVAEQIAEAWEELGFNVTLQKVATIQNDDYSLLIDDTPTDFCDDIHGESLRAGEFEAILFDACAFSPDAYGMLAPFAQGFTGRAVDLTDENDVAVPTHVTGFASEEYNALIESMSTEKDTAKRADLYRQAEKMLMDEMPVIPVLFNLDATVTSEKLTDVESTYYLNADFTDAYIKDYDEYIAAGEKFIADNFAEMGFHNSTNCAYHVEPMPEDGADADWEAARDEAYEIFKTSSSIYSHFYPVEETEE